MNNIKILRWVSGFVAAYHLCLGLLGMFASATFTERLISTFYGASLTVDGTLLYVTKFLAAYFIAFGCMMALVAMDPVRHLKIVPIAVLFFAIRLVQLVYFNNFVSQQLMVGDATIVQKIIAFVVLDIVLIYLYSKVSGQKLAAA